MKVVRLGLGLDRFFEKVGVRVRIRVIKLQFDQDEAARSAGEEGEISSERAREDGHPRMGEKLRVRVRYRC